MSEHGFRVLSDRYRTKETAFTDGERDRLGLHGLVSSVVEDRVELTDLERHVFLPSFDRRAPRSKPVVGAGWSTATAWSTTR